MSRASRLLFNLRARSTLARRMGALRRWLFGAFVLFGLVACIQIPVEVQQEFEIDRDSGRNHFVARDNGAESIPPAGE